MFRNFILQNFPMLEDDFDALTDYELFCKMLGYVKEFVKDNEEFKKQLSTYENYFKNLDVQEEINNKLDEMAESGELADIIAQYLGLAGVLVFNTVEDLKNATNLTNGSIAKTLGYNNIQDCGGGYYKIRTITNLDTVDNAFIISLNNESLIAELIITPILNITELGVMENDEISNILQKAILKDKVENINLLNMEFDIDTTINLKSNFKLCNGIINSHNLIHVFEGTDLTNINFKNITINGNNNSQVGIYLSRCNNYNISDCKFYNLEIISGSCNSVENHSCKYGLIEKCESYNIGNNSIGDEHFEPRGFIIVNSSNININNCYIHDIYSTNNHGDGIHFDSNTNTEFSNNIVTNCTIQDCAYRGIKLQQRGITIENNRIIEGNADRSLQQSAISVYNNDIILKNNYISQKCDIAVTIGTSNTQTDESKNIIIDGNKFDFKNSLSYGVISIPNIARIVENVTITNNIFNILDTNKKPYSVLLLGHFNNVNISNNIFNGGEVFTMVKKALNDTEQSKNNLIVTNNNGITKQSLVVFDDDVEITNGVISNNNAFYDTPLDFVSGHNSVRTSNVALYKTFKIKNNNISSNSDIHFYDGARDYGATTSRPTNGVNNGFQYFDSTLHQIVVFYNNNWYLPDGTISN